MKKLLLLSAFISLVLPAYAQIQWQKCIGGSDFDNAEDIHQTTDGGYIVAGNAISNDGNVTGNHGENDAWVVKLSSLGDIEWQKCLGGSGADFASSVQQTSDGGFIVAGSSYSLDGDVTGVHDPDHLDFWVMKLSSSGGLVWQKCLGGSSDEEAYSVQETKDGGYIVAGSAYSSDGDVTGAHGGQDAWVVKLSSAGAIEWQKAFGGNKNEYAASICQTFDGGYIFTGPSYSADGDITGHHGSSSTYADCWVVKLSATGNIEWQRSLGGTNNDLAYSIRQTFDSGYIMAGSTSSPDGDVTNLIGTIYSTQDLWVVKLSAGGAMQWNKCIDTGGAETGYSIQQTTDTGYIVCGKTIHYSPSRPSNFLVVKLSGGGDMVWQGELGGSSAEEAYSVQETKDGGYIACGATFSYDGDVSGNHGEDDGWIVKLGSKPNAVTDITHTAAITVLPNPAANELIVTSPEIITSIAIADLAGQTVCTYSCNARQVKVNVAGLAAGMYLVRVNGMVVRRFVKQ